MLAGGDISNVPAPARKPEVADKQAEASVDIELVIAVDVSYSMDLDELAIQCEGFARRSCPKNFAPRKSADASSQSSQQTLKATAASWAPTSVVLQHAAPERLIRGGLPTERLVAHVIDANYQWHLPLYRQAQMLATHGIALDRSTLAFWVGYAAQELKPLWHRLSCSPVPFALRHDRLHLTLQAAFGWTNSKRLAATQLMLA
jgi:hypothetical protein